MAEKKKVLMICLGNICRSPIAEAVFDDQISKLGLRNSWEVDSAALIGYHTGKGPDHRAMSTLRENGITNYSHKARPITEEDFHNYDWIFGMDNSNMTELKDLQPKNSRAKCELLGEYDPKGEKIIRDPYYDAGSAGFQKAYEQCVRSIGAFLEKHKGNSCRSPIAQAVFADRIEKMGLSIAWEVDSAALLTYHRGKSPEPRAMTTLEKNGINGFKHKARVITYDDFYKFDWIFGMDSNIVYELYTMRPADSQAKIECLGMYDPNGETDIRDPLFDSDSTGFEKAYEQSVRSIETFLNMHKDKY